eukprot:3637558-Rhodomonas_salina.2
MPLGGVRIKFNSRIKWRESQTPAVAGVRIRYRSVSTDSERIAPGRRMAIAQSSPGIPVPQTLGIVSQSLLLSLAYRGRDSQLARSTSGNWKVGAEHLGSRFLGNTFDAHSVAAPLTGTSV